MSPFQIGDHLISPKHPKLSLTVILVDPDGEWCRCKDDYGTELYA